jgi:hypothetical protein
MLFRAREAVTHCPHGEVCAARVLPALQHLQGAIYTCVLGKDVLRSERFTATSFAIKQVLELPPSGKDPVFERPAENKAICQAGRPTIGGFGVTAAPDRDRASWAGVKRRVVDVIEATVEGQRALAP